MSIAPSPIAGVATSICAFIGTAPRGPLDTALAIRSFGEYEKHFGGLAVDANNISYALAFAVHDFFANGGTEAFAVRVGSGGKPASGAVGELVLEATSPGRWGENVRVLADYGTGDPQRGSFNLTVREVVNDNVLRSERFADLSMNPGDPRYAIDFLQANSSLVHVKMLGVIPSDPTEFIPFSNGAEPNVSVADVVGDGATTGMYALENVDLFNILCIPPIAQVTPAIDVRAVIRDAAAYARKRRAFFIADPPDSWNSWEGDPAATLESIAGDLRAFREADPECGAIFFPNIVRPNSAADDRLEGFAPSGAVAGVFARTDTNVGVWRTPAGREAVLCDVPQFAVSLAGDVAAQLAEIGVNCLREFPEAGRVVWGSRTFGGADAISVRRFSLFLEESIERGTTWAVSEPNCEPLWAQVRANVGDFLQEIFHRGAFPGSTPEEAYFVKCDAGTMTQDDIDRGTLVIDVGFAPVRPAEFVIFRIFQHGTDCTKKSPP
ncbi:MAG: phage tail sheath subtilisin-like domain-containing protein [Candidatus Velthaea sp.]